MMMGSIKPESTGSPNTVPAPSSSRIMPMARSVAVKQQRDSGRGNYRSQYSSSQYRDP